MLCCVCDSKGALPFRDHARSIGIILGPYHLELFCLLPRPTASLHLLLPSPISAMFHVRMPVYRVRGGAATILSLRSSDKSSRS